MASWARLEIQPSAPETPVTTNRRGLFLPRLPEGAEQTYCNLFAPAKERSALVRDECEALWRDFHDLADPAFVDRLPFEFHQRWFEMYLGAALRRAGLHVEAPKPGPDFRVLVNGRPIYIEAVAPTGGNPLHPDAVPDPVYKDARGRPMAARVPHDQITLRLADAFRRKADVIDGYRRKCYIGGEDPCLIAINLQDIPHAWADADEFWFRALYGVGNRFVVLDREGHAQSEGREHRAILHRARGAAEDVAPLLNPDRGGVSGVLGSAADVGNMPSPLGDDFLLLPHAVPRAPYPQASCRGERRSGYTLTITAHGTCRPSITVHIPRADPRPSKSMSRGNLSLRSGLSRDGN